MQFESGKLYHVYNQGNNRQPIFYKRENYLYFQEKMRKQLTPLCELMAYCLMPNHFHWLLHIKMIEGGKTHPSAADGRTDTPARVLVRKIAVLLSSYAQAINKQEKRSGSLFRQKTKAVEIGSREYTLSCIHYIHQNPVTAGLVRELDHWKFSSFHAYNDTISDPLIDTDKALRIIGMKRKQFIRESFRALNQEYPSDRSKRSDG